MNKLISVECVHDLAKFETLREQWNFLLFNSKDRDIFLTWEWQFAWWKNIGQKKYELRILLVKEGEQIIGIAPWMFSKKAKSIFNLNWLENLGNPDCDISGIITSKPDQTIKAIIEYLKADILNWDIIELQELSALSQNTQTLMNELQNSGFYFIEAEDEDHYFIKINTTWEDYYNNLSKNLRHNHKRRIKRAAEIGPIEIQRFSGTSLEWQHFQTIFLVNKKSSFPELYNSEENVAFHKDLFLLMRDKKWIQIEIFMLKGEPIAYQYGFTFESRYEDWRGGINKDYDIIAPGKLLMMQTLEHRFKENIIESDFLRGNHTYKKDWLPESRKYKKIQVFNQNKLKSRAAFLWVQKIRPLFSNKLNKKLNKNDSDQS